MPLDGRPAKKNKDRLIGFRVDEDAFNEIENRAALAGKSPNDWCRDELLARLAEVVPLTANEELIHGEIIKYGGVLMGFVMAVMKGELNPEKANELLAFAHRDRKLIAKNYFARARKELQGG
jgi:hypothetical protein